MGTTVEEMKSRLRRIEEKIRDYKEQMPAHSVKPMMMQRLLELEDERDALLAKITK
ncbi:MAG: hypothetical protein Q8P24_05805 [Desulfobacterales bacterium]|nr:hypothetical protein [Desulfobacterales bacterium]